ncbi:MAG: 30S ribosome-binding factor RbfA [Saprospiraceae bacterium]
METIRQKQVGELIRRQFSTVLFTEGKYIFGQEALVSITEVKMSADLSTAKVYLSVFNMLNKQEVILMMEDQYPKLKFALHSKLRKQLRSMPELRFYLDETIEEAFKMEELFNKLREDKQLGED